MEQRILKDSTQTLLTYPRVGPDGIPINGTPANVQVRISTPAVPTTEDDDFDDADADITFGTVDEDADEGDDFLLYAPSATFVQERQYLVTTPDGEVFVVKSGMSGTGAVVGSAFKLVLTEPLPVAVDEGSAIQGMAITVDLTAEQTALVGKKCIAFWRGEVGGIQYDWSDSFRIVKRIPTIPITAADLTERRAIVHELRRGNDRLNLETLSAAWRYVQHRLLRRGIDPEDIVDVSPLEEATLDACVLHLIKMRRDADDAEIKRWQDSFAANLDGALDRTDWLESTQDSEPSPSTTATTTRSSVARVGR